MSKRTHGGVGTSERHGTASAVLLRPVLGYARTQGVEVDALLREIDVSREALEDFDRRLPLSAFRRVWTDLPVLAGDPYFGLHVAERAEVTEYDVLGCAFYFSETLGHGLNRLQRFYRVLGDQLASELTVDGPVARLRHRSKTTRHETECFLATVALSARALTRESVDPSAVRIAHPAPAETVHHRDVFRAPVRFGCAFSELDFATKDLALPLTTANVRVGSVLDRYMTELLAKLPPDTTFIERAQFAVAEQLRKGTGRPAVAATATALKTSPRTLQRRLGGHGISHEELVDRVRRTMAERMVADRRMSMTEIAFVLGYADVSGFRRAYERWTGVSPAHARAS